ncbi:transcription elongation factor GreA [Tepidiforma thermophila]|uniref:Transcription elongation factor GreA n=1 Tax=Tepidiforma thermophila (strain KCTC 52669 / CGMCC 1.13589 / G233) TaxID=2761530 RepID=A0A2A9HGA4_TEPT2|nr:transcription elongation factor GreA [Tepidiforma thermophila]PFG73849.1 transcription elongation factor GreA [Tepidiforma thermophila]
MTQTPAGATTTPVTLREALRQFTASLKPAEREYAAYVEKFCNDVGLDRIAADLTPAIVEQYGERNLRPTDPNGQRRLDALKAWFRFLKTKGYTERNLGTGLRLPKSNGPRTTSASPRVVETPIEMTAEGIEALKRELADLERRIPDLIRAVETARSDGDLRENAPYHAAREALALAENRRRQLEESLKRAVVADRSELDHDVAAIGSGVTVTFLERNIQVTYQLVGPREANPAEKKISVESPVGRVLLGRRVGEEVEVEAPQGTMRYRIDAIIHNP